MERKHLSHDILNLLERLRIMHELARDQNFTVISKAELAEDLAASLKQLQDKFDRLLQ